MCTMYSLQLNSRRSSFSTTDFIVVALLLFVNYLQQTIGHYCPVDQVHGCSCYFTYITCEQMGNLKQVPPLGISKYMVDKFDIGSGTSITKIQANAFLGLPIVSLVLISLSIQAIDEAAFAGLS